MFNYVMPQVSVTLIQIHWLLLEGVDTHQIDVTTVSHIGILPTTAIFYSNKMTPSPRKLSNSSIPAPTQPRQHDTHVQAYRKHKAAKHKAAMME